MKIGVSVVICCYNSKERLKPTLEHIAKQTVSKNIMWEVIVVDNNSNDNTKVYAENIWQNLDCNIPFLTVVEPKSGLSYAREKGIATAKYEYVLFCDDDNWLCNTYVNNLYAIFSQKEKVGIIGGSNTAVANENFPEWFETVKTYYAIGKLYDKDKELTNVLQGVFGAGMGLRKSVYQALKKKGFEFSFSDRKGKSLSGGGDIELRAAFGLMGYTCYYSEKLNLQHFVPKERLNKQYVKKLAYEWGKVVFLICAYDHHKRMSKSIFTYLLWVLKHLFFLIIATFKLFTHGFEGYCYFLTRYGTFYSQLTESKKYFNLRNNLEVYFNK